MVIARQAIGRGPPLWTLFLAGAFATVALGVLSVAGAEAALATAAPTLVFLFALFLFAVELDRAGAIDRLARWVLGRARRPEDLPLVLFVGIGLFSAVMVNDALVVIGVPLLVAIARGSRVDAKPLLLVLGFSVTVGSTLTPFGNPQNLIVAVASGVASPVTTFLRYLAIPTAINLGVGGLYVRWAYRRSMAEARVDPVAAHRGLPLFPPDGWRRRLIEHPVLWIFPATMVCLVTLDVVAAATHGPQVPPWETALGGAVLLLLVSSQRTPALYRVNWSVLVLFAGLFVVVAGAVAGGLIPALERLLPIPGPGHPTEALFAIVGTSVGGPQLVSNVPWVVLQVPVLQGLGYGGGTPVVWMALAAGSTLAGNVTLLGAASNVILVEAGDRHGVHISLADFMRDGLPIAAMTLAVLVACLWLGL